MALWRDGHNAKAPQRHSAYLLYKVSLATERPPLTAPLETAVAKRAPARPIPEPEMTQLATIGIVRTGIKAVIKEAAAGNFEKKKAKDGSHYFVVRSKNGQQVGKSQMYKSASGVAAGMRAVTNNAVNEITEVEA